MKISVVFIDFEATGLYSKADIVEIGAVSESGLTFNVYLETTEDFVEAAAKVTGLSLDTKHRLSKNGVLLDTVSRKEGFEQFYEFLRFVHSGEKYLVLASHGANDFDMPLLKANLLRLGYDLWDRFDKLNLRFCDTLVFAKTFRKPLKLRRLRLRDIAKTLGVSYEEVNHEALSDAQLTKRVAEAMGINDSNIDECLFNWDSAHFRIH